MNCIPPSPTIGTSLRVLGTTVTYLATELQTGGSYSMFELIVPVGEGMLPHRHILEAEQLHVLEGRMAVRLNDELQTLEAGQSVFVPRGAVHAYQNIGSGPARVLALVSPGFLHEKFFAELGAICDLHDKFLAEIGLQNGQPKGPVDLAALVEIAARYEIEVLPL